MRNRFTAVTEGRILGDAPVFMRFSVAYCILGILRVDEWFLCVSLVELVRRDQG